MNDYSITARYYDASYEAKQLADLPFYLELAEKRGGPVLDIGCGTGRMTLPLARRGSQVTAIDASEPMLEILRGKLAAEPADVRSRVTVKMRDMRNLDTDSRFPLVIVPFRGLQHLHTIEDQMAALTSLRGQLAAGGWLALDVFFPKLDRIMTGVGQEIEEMNWTTMEEGKKLVVRRFFMKNAVDPLGLKFSGRFIYRTFSGSTLVREESDSLTMTCYTYHQLRLLFLLTGLEPVAEYGSFTKTTLAGDSSEMIFILREKVV
jgi:SAM-dependent methyltransferase